MLFPPAGLPCRFLLQYHRPVSGSWCQALGLSHCKSDAQAGSSELPGIDPAAAAAGSPEAAGAAPFFPPADGFPPAAGATGQLQALQGGGPPLTLPLPLPLSWPLSWIGGPPAAFATGCPLPLPTGRQPLDLLTNTDAAGATPFPPDAAGATSSGGDAAGAAPLSPDAAGATPFPDPAARFLGGKMESELSERSTLAFMAGEQQSKPR